MSNKEVVWTKYTKEELVLIIKYIQKSAAYYTPWVIRDAVDFVEKRRLEQLREEMRMYDEMAHEARMEAAKILNEAEKAEKEETAETLEVVAALMKKAHGATLASHRAADKYDALMGLK